MKILLLAMPDAVNFYDIYMRMPNLGIVSLAGNLTDHEVKTLDLVLHRPKIRKALEETLSSFQPQVVGLSAMSYQFDSLLRVAWFVRRWNPSIRIVAGGYHVSLLGKEITESDDSLLIDFLIRGEGEATFRELITELEKPVPDLTGIRQLSYRQNGK